MMGVGGETMAQKQVQRPHAGAEMTGHGRWVGETTE